MRVSSNAIRAGLVAPLAALAASTAHAQIFRGLPVQAEVVHARTQRKPSRSVTAVFDTRATWTA